MTDYLAQYDKAKKTDKYPLVLKWLKTEPIPFTAQLRKERPILVTPECTLVSLFPDVRDVLQMPKTFTVDLYKPKMGAVDVPDGYLMAYDDDALHYREKSIMQGFLNREDLPHVRALIADAGKKILDEADGSIEFVQNYTRMVPAFLVHDYFGLDGIDKEDLIRWSFWNQYDVFHNQPFDLNTPEQAASITASHDAVNTELKAYIASLVLRKGLGVKLGKLLAIFLLPLKFIIKILYRIIGKEQRPKMDIVKRMLRSKFDKSVDFNIKRIAINAGGLLIGSIETTSQAVAQVVEFLMDDPARLAEAHVKAEQDDHSEFDALVWEALRFVPISPYMFRTAGDNYTIAKGTKHATTVHAGTNVLLLTQSAMFDNYAYKNPDKFMPDRNWYHNFNFGFASHECLGKYIGMVMIPEMVRQIFLRGNLRSQGPINYEDGPFPEQLHLSWDA